MDDSSHLLEEHLCRPFRGRGSNDLLASPMYQAFTFLKFVDMHNRTHKYKSFSCSHAFISFYTLSLCPLILQRRHISNMRTASLLVLLASARTILGDCNDACATAITAIGEINVGLQSRSIDCAKFIETSTTPDAVFVNSDSIHILD